MNLTKNQEEFFLDKFFHSAYPKSNEVALKLIRTGKCIVPSNTQIFEGGICNFIKVKSAENSIDCLLYILDMNDLMSLKFYKEIHEDYLFKLSAEIFKLGKAFEEVYNLSETHNYGSYI